MDYDSLGNRLQQASSNVAFTWTPENCTTTGTLYQNVWASFDDYNHISQTNASGSLVMNTPQTPVYDGGGNVINDGSNQYLYDSENRICAVSSYAGMTGYIYDAEGNRTAKGTLSSWSCPTATNFTLATAYVVGASGEQLTEIGSAGDWHHTNVWAGGKLIATYNTGGLHFHIDDPLGTRRAQTNRDGQLEATYQSLPYGDGYSATYAQNVVDDPTENHFTAKERDAESGNDFMFARYYNSATGRFLSPDWSARVEPVPYSKLDDPQTLNLYAYVGNNPIDRFDPDGHFAGDHAFSDAISGLNASNETASRTDKQAGTQQTSQEGTVNYHGHKVSDPRVRSALDKLASVTGGTINVVSGDRDFVPRGGALHSLHLAGKAADFHMKEYSDDAVDAFLHNTHFKEFQGINVIQHGPYSQTEGPHIHIDSRNEPGTPTTFMHEGMTPGSRGYIIEKSEPNN